MNKKMEMYRDRLKGYIGFGRSKDFFYGYVFCLYDNHKLNEQEYKGLKDYIEELFKKNKEMGNG